jgi:formate dehydrogenase beta subunit
MSQVVFSTWGGEFIDNRDKPSEEWGQSAFKLPEDYTADRRSKAFIGWDGVAIFQEDVDAVRLATEYAAQYQVYSEACGRCAPGRWGGRILYDLLDKIARGEGSHEDVAHLKEVSQTMMLTSKCEIGKTVPKPILDLMEHYKEQFDSAIEAQKPSKHYNHDIGYIAKVTAPCTDMCPAHVDIPAYIEGVRDMLFEDSLAATRQTMPLAHTCGRVCPHPCEDACRRTNLDSPISIMELKRLGADYETDHGLPWMHPTEPKPLRNDGKKVAIVGAGPAGLTAAYYLALEGIKVDIFEELPVLGGEVAVGVPEYRMPVDKYNKDIELVTSMEAVTVYSNHRVDSARLQELDSE